MDKNKYYNEKICVICGNHFKVPKRKKPKGRPSGKRPMNSITCSKKCSRIYSSPNLNKTKEKDEN